MCNIMYVCGVHTKGEFKEIYVMLNTQFRSGFHDMNCEKIRACVRNIDDRVFRNLSN